MPTAYEIELFTSEFIEMQRTEELDYILTARFGELEFGCMVRYERNDEFLRLKLLEACQSIMEKLFEEAGV